MTDLDLMQRTIEMEIRVLQTYIQQNHGLDQNEYVLIIQWISSISLRKFFNFWKTLFNYLFRYVENIKKRLNYYTCEILSVNRVFSTVIELLTKPLCILIYNQSFFCITTTLIYYFLAVDFLFLGKLNFQKLSFSKTRIEESKEKLSILQKRMYKSMAMVRN